MKILILTAYFNPEIISSPYLGESKRKALANAGFDMVLITPSPTRGVSKADRKKFKKIRYEEKYDGRLKIHRFPMFREYNNSFLRAIRYLGCSIIQFFLGVFTKDIDLISVASTPPTQGALAVMIKKLKKVPVLYNLQDIFPDSLVNAGITRRNSLLWKVGRLIENFTYKNVEQIIVISEDLKQNILDKGVPSCKISIIPNWADENVVVDIPRDENSLFDKFSLDRRLFYISYCGNIGLSQNFDLLIEAACDFKLNKNIMFVLIGDGPYKSEIEKKITELKLDNFKLFPYQPYGDISHVFSLGDVGLIISKPNVGTASVPSKTWNIMSAQRPIIASFDMDSELCSIIQHANCGICVPPDDKDLLKNAIIELYHNQDQVRVKGQNGRKYLLENLSSGEGISKYIELINSFEAG